MSTDRANLDQENSNAIYIALTVIMLVLSVVGLYLYLRTSTSPAVDLVSITTPAPDQITDVVPTITSVPDNQPLITVNPSATPTPTIKTLISDVDDFSVDYSSSRTLYQDKEGSGTRYTLYSPSGNIAIHVGPSWSWVYPNRQFTDTLLVADQPTFRYDISSQTIVDFQSGTKKYTIQCLHHGQDSLEAECQQILTDFKLL